MSDEMSTPHATGISAIGNCDHLYWPEYLTPEARALVELRGLSVAEPPCGAGVDNEDRG